MSTEKYNDDLSMFKYLLRASVVSYKMTFYDDIDIFYGKKKEIPIIDKVIFPSDFINYNGHTSILRIQTPNYGICVGYRFNGFGQIYICDVKLLCENYNLYFVCNFQSYTISSTNTLPIELSRSMFINTIEQIENKNNFNEIRDYLKSIDDNFLQTYMTIVRHCFNLIGG
jgi:hypothetical protein